MMASISESVCISISHITIHLLNILFLCYISSQENYTNKGKEKGGKSGVFN